MDDLLKNVTHPPIIHRGTAETIFLRAQILYPVILLVAFVLSAAVHSILTSRSEEELDVPTVTGPGGKPLPVTKRKREQEEPRDLDSDGQSTGLVAFKHLAAVVVLTFLANGLALVAHLNSHHPKYDALQDPHWQCSEERMVYLIGSAFLYFYVLITLFDWKPSPTPVHMIVWMLGLVGELTITVSSLYVLWAPVNTVEIQQLGHANHDRVRGWDMFGFAVSIARLSLITLLAGLYAALKTRKSFKERRLLDEESNRSDTDETSPLLMGNGANYHTQTNGHASNGRNRAGSNFNGSQASSCQQPEEEAAFYRPEKLPHKSWYEYCRGYSVFFPYLWPSDSLKLQGVVLLCFILIIFQRIVNVMVPTQIGKVTELLKQRDDDWKTQVGLLIVYKLLQGQAGLLGSLRSILWIPVSQHTYRALTTASFEHVHSLSLDFHLGKRTGEVLSALNKGASINQFLEQVTFQVIPMLVDLLVAIVYFYLKFGPMYSLFVSIITFYYLYLTIRMAATRADQRRDMVNADREEEAVKNDSITSYETVKYFNAEKYEFNRYRNAIITFQKAEAKVTWGINHMNMCQSLVFMSGIMVAMMYCANEVRLGTRKVGDFVALVTYLGQLQGPLNFFGTFYRTVQQAMISGERLLELFKIQPTVVDKPNVEALPECTGHIKWDDVGFSYDKRRTALHNLSFECKPGTTTAFVGESGGGKSTVFRLMFRYYNCQTGKIQIDGQDVKDLTIDSVRRFIGVVPQDTMLFNETLMYNLQYANPQATEEDVFEACRAAAIHDRIMSFPDGYLTKVGERGLRLSGGEKQRVAIARTILKNPKIIMLDEATSALDGETEQKIQSKLISGNFGQDRTLLIIAHRLSTITHADQIIVLHAGTIVEKGTHQELLALNGRYASMWDKHCRAEQAAEAARDATRKARKLLCQANLSRGDESPSGFTSLANSTILHPGHIITTGPGSPNDTSSQTDSDSVSGDSARSENGSEGTLRDDSSDDSHHETMAGEYETATLDQTTSQSGAGYVPLHPHIESTNGREPVIQHASTQHVQALRQDL
ncbi:heavy metal tolerance protein [Rhypophila decipiens]|uniref:Heavy metal tolerance protein n=1 Tax=Rhypophila decipiens TaxID=261697 RepID=A0AAN6YGI1_9PEZI|nr:heavy metal tolerance protein [Rhypophila decipiens]